MEKSITKSFSLNLVRDRLMDFNLLGLLLLAITLAKSNVVIGFPLKSISTALCLLLDSNDSNIIVELAEVRPREDKPILLTVG